MAITAGEDILAADFIDESARNATPSNDSGRVPKLESSGFLARNWLSNGDGSDGALSSSSGTTTIDLGSAKVVVKQYTSISLTGTAELAFSNPHANGTFVIFLVQGDVTLTSSNDPGIELQGMGANGGAGVADVNPPSPNGNSAFCWYSSAVPAGGQGGQSNNDHAGGGGGAEDGVTADGTGGAGAYNDAALAALLQAFDGNIRWHVGAGGGAGAGNGSTGGSDGGDGAGALLIKCGGAFNKTCIVDADGGDGGNNNNGDGGGGGGGFFGVICGSITANSGAVRVSGGIGGGGNGGGGGAGYSFVMTSDEHG